MNIKRITCFSVLMGIKIFVNAQSFQVSAELRPRYEFRHGFGTLRPADPEKDQPVQFVGQRSRLSFLYYDPKQKLRMIARVQDIRTWGATSQTSIAEAGRQLGLFEFWAELEILKNTALKVGRQSLAYDNGRIITAADWLQQARSFDIALLKYENQKQKFSTHLGLGLNTTSESTRKEVYNINNYKALQLLWLNKKITDINASILFLNNGEEYTIDPSIVPEGTVPLPENRAIAYSQTLGGRLQFFETRRMGFNIEGYYQGGRDDENTRLNAWLISAELWRKITQNLSLITGFEILSGTSNVTDESVNHSFNPLYAAGHKFDGYMDYFYVSNRWHNNVGLCDYYVGFRYKKNQFFGETAAHIQTAQAPVIRDGEALKKMLAVEGDLVLGYNLSEIGNIQGGFSLLKGSSTLQFLQNGSDSKKLNTYAWLQLTIKPTLFSYDKER